MKFEFSLVDALMFKYNIIGTFAQNANFTILSQRTGGFIVVAHNEEAAKGATPEQILEGLSYSKGYQKIFVEQFKQIKIDGFAIEHLKVKGFAHID